MGRPELHPGVQFVLPSRCRNEHANAEIVFIVTVATGVQDRPALAPQTGPWNSDYKLFNSPSFLQAMSGVSSLVFAYAGTPTFFPIAAEMRRPDQYLKSLIISQTAVTLVYITIGIVVYYYCGTYVASPALGSAGVLMKKICYGIALPGLIVTAVLICHVRLLGNLSYGRHDANTIQMPAKYVFVRLLRGTKHLSSNTPVHWMVWFCCTASAALIAYIIASAIPDFSSLVSLVGALLGTPLSFQPMGCMWLYDNWSTSRDLTWKLKAGFSVFMIVAGTFLMVSGTYSSILDIIHAYSKSTGGSWSCADNSNSS